MATYEVLVTDVTNYGTLFCVAGWERNRNKMVRPEPAGANKDNESSRFWSANSAGPGTVFSVGNIVHFTASPPPADFPYPHATEDLVVNANSQISVSGKRTPKQIALEVSCSVAPTLAAAFENKLIHAYSGKAYVAAGSTSRSLGALEILPTKLEFYEDNKNPPKLRAMIEEDGVEYDLAVTADALRTRWREDGLKGLNADLKASKKLHVRVGLSRPFNMIPDKCFSQINGLLFL